jgi:hypothetical protein
MRSGDGHLPPRGPGLAEVCGTKGASRFLSRFRAEFLRIGLPILLVDHRPTRRRDRLRAMSLGRFVFSVPMAKYPTVDQSLPPRM